MLRRRRDGGPALPRPAGRRARGRFGGPPKRRQRARHCASRDGGLYFRSAGVICATAWLGPNGFRADPRPGRATTAPPSQRRSSGPAGRRARGRFGGPPKRRQRARRCASRDGGLYFRSAGVICATAWLGPNGFRADPRPGRATNAPSPARRRSAAPFVPPGGGRHGWLFRAVADGRGAGAAAVAGATASGPTASLAARSWERARLVGNGPSRTRPGPGAGWRGIPCPPGPGGPTNAPRRRDGGPVLLGPWRACRGPCPALSSDKSVRSGGSDRSVSQGGVFGRWT